MAFLKNIFNKKEEIISSEEIEKVENLIKQNKKNIDEIYIDLEKKEKSIQKEKTIDKPKIYENKIYENNINFKEIISKIRINDINKIRNLLDERERELTGDNSLYKPKTQDNESFIGGNEKKKIDSIEIGNKYKKEDLDNQTYEEEEEKKETPKTKKEIQKKDNSNQKIINEIEGIFGEKNIILKQEKEITKIGIRNLEGFETQIHWADQNKWFISKIKKFSALKNFKISKSDEGSKDLINNDNSLMISFRSTNLLKNKKSFDFSN